MVTIKMISELSGVSRGTVDRVLNGRGNVNPNTAAHVEKMAKQLGYRPNLAGKALAVRKKSYVIGVLLTAKGNQFFDEVVRGIENAGEELLEYGVTIHTELIKGYDSKAQLSAISSLSKEVNALIFNPINDKAIADKMNELSGQGFPVVTLNTDIEGAHRLSYVGPDYLHNGKTAGGLMNLLLPSEAASGVAVFSGSPDILGHALRVKGMRAVLAEKRPGYPVLETLYTEDDDVVAYGKAERFFGNHPDLNGIYIAAAGTYGVCRAAMSIYKGGRPIIVCSDAIPSTIEMMEQNIVHAAICQQPYQQGYQSVRCAFHYLLSGERTGDCIMKSEIRIKENV